MKLKGTPKKIHLFFVFYVLGIGLFICAKSKMFADDREQIPPQNSWHKAPQPSAENQINCTSFLSTTIN